MRQGSQGFQGGCQFGLGGLGERRGRVGQVVFDLHLRGPDVEHDLQAHHHRERERGKQDHRHQVAA